MVAHEILVSAKGPLVLGFWVLGIRVWGLGLTIYVMCPRPTINDGKITFCIYMHLLLYICIKDSFDHIIGLDLYFDQSKLSTFTISAASPKSFFTCSCCALNACASLIVFWAKILSSSLSFWACRSYPLTNLRVHWTVR